MNLPIMFFNFFSGKSTQNELEDKQLIFRTMAILILYVEKLLPKEGKAMFLPYKKEEKEEGDEEESVEKRPTHPIFAISIA